MAMANQRFYKRFSFLEPVEYRKPSLYSTGSLANNISVGGIKLRVGEFIPVSTILELGINLENTSRVVPIKGKVVWIGESLSEGMYDIGLEFIKEEDSVRAIHEYLETRQLD